VLLGLQTFSCKLHNTTPMACYIQKKLLIDQVRA
jgi:hypothetical protein